MTKLFLALLFSVVTSVANAQLTGEMRKGFLEGHRESCFKTQRSASANKSVDDKTLSQYCRCNAVYIADVLNNNLAISIEKGEQKINMNLISLASNFCSKNFSKY